MCTLPEKCQTSRYTQSTKTIPSLTIQVSPNPAVPTVRSSFPKLSRQTNSSKEFSSIEKMASTSHLSRSGNWCAVRYRQTVLRLFYDPQCSHFRVRSHRSPRLQDQLSTQSSSRSLHTRSARSQCRTPGRPSPVKWRLVPQDWSGDCHAVCRSAPRIPENVCQDVR